jgi:hypothetical protein
MWYLRCAGAQGERHLYEGAHEQLENDGVLRLILAKRGADVGHFVAVMVMQVCGTCVRTVFRKQRSK